jgi:O-antigen ligase
MPNKEIQLIDITRYSKFATAMGSIILLIFFVANNYFLPLISFVTLLTLSYIIAQFSLHHFFRVMVFMIPLSQNQNIFDSEVSMLMPSEPLEALIIIAFGIKILLGYKVSSSILKHPLFLVMLCWLFLQYVALINSDIPVVSLKSMVLKTCYFITFYVLCAELYVRKQINHIQILKTYLFSIFIIGIIIFFTHFQHNLSKDVSGSVTEPFYADHTIYSACLAFVLPLPLLYLCYNKKLQINFYQKFWLFCFSAVLLIFFFFTYCRAGWISLVLASVLTIAIFLGLRFKGLVMLFLSTIAIFFYFRTEIIDGFKQNKSDSNAKNATLEQQTKSVTNITSDQSNAERLNRWSCAWRMFLDRPLLGYGPGTYQFEYLSYQKKSEMSAISVTSPYNIKKGKGGTAHSEYLLVLSESGILSLIAYLFCLFMAYYYAIKIFATNNDHKIRINIMIIFFGFTTYNLHAFFNNFLDTDKAALLFYTSIAAIMSYSIQLKNKVNTI